MEAERACMHAHAPCSSMREVGSKQIGGVSTAVRLLSAARRLSPGASNTSISVAVDVRRMWG